RQPELQPPLALAQQPHRGAELPPDAAHREQAMLQSKSRAAAGQAAQEQLLELDAPGRHAQAWRAQAERYHYYLLPHRRRRQITRPITSFSLDCWKNY